MANQYEPNGVKYFPGPPCLASKKFRSVCETASCCLKIGPFGLQFFHRNRNGIMAFGACTSLLSLILTIFACLSLSGTSDAVSSYPWATQSIALMQDNGDSVDIDVYIGLSGVAFESSVDGVGNMTDFIKWSDDTCADNTDDNPLQLTNECEDCKEATEAYVGTVVISAITLLPQLSTDLTRRSTRGDLNCQKFFGTFTALLGFVTGISGLLSYKGTCIDAFGSVQACNQDGSGCVDLETDLGIGYTCLLLATIFKLVDFTIHLLTPTPPYRHDADTNVLFDPESGESNKKGEPELNSIAMKRT